MQKYQISNKRHYIDKNTGVEVPFKSKTTFTLDSTLELKVYRELMDNYPDLIDVEAHRAISLGSRNWVIDFVLYAKGVQGRKLFKELLQFYGKERGSSVLYLECKGVQDNNFKSKLGELLINSPYVADCLMLVGYEGGAFYQETQNTYTLKPILSLGLFIKKLAEIRERM